MRCYLFLLCAAAAFWVGAEGANTLPQLPDNYYNDISFLLTYLNKLQPILSVAMTRRVISPYDYETVSQKSREISMWLYKDENRFAKPDELRAKEAEFQATAAPVLKVIQDSSVDLSKN